MGSGYPIAAEAFDYEVFQLACVFAASRELSKLASEHRGIECLREVLELSEAARRLISVAAMVRSAMDTWSSSGRKAKARKVGELTPDVSNPAKSTALTFREACNKILHAENITLIDETDASAGLLSYSVILEGQKFVGRKNEKRTEEWRADLNILAFLDAASHVA